MKKIFWSIMLLLVVIIVVLAVKITDNTNKKTSVAGFNAEFEDYKDKTIYGADVITIINKAIDNNENYNIEKDENSFYIDDNKYCLKVDLTLLTKDEKEQIKEVNYSMEVLQKAGLDGFISSFSLTGFKCTNVSYNQTGRISKISLKQIEE